MKTTCKHDFELIRGKYINYLRCKLCGFMKQVDIFGDKV